MPEVRPAERNKLEQVFILFYLQVSANVRRNGIPANIYFVHSSSSNQLFA